MPSSLSQYDANKEEIFKGDYVLRMAKPEESCEIIKLQNRLGKEEDFLMVTPMDPVTGASLLRASLEKPGSMGRTCVIVAEFSGQIIGLALCRDHLHPFLRGMAQLTLCVDRTHRRRGLGSSLILKTVNWAEQTGIRRLQLAVIASNDAAVATYLKTGFQIEGTLNNAAVIGGSAFDLLIMGRHIIPMRTTARDET